jgi:hypothetical protein
MFSVGAGQIDHSLVSELTVRPAFHALSDPQGGYVPGNQIKFFETVARWSEERGIEIGRFTALDITALTPRDRFFKPISWRVNLSYDQYQRQKRDALGLGSLTAGGGHSYQVADSLLVYGLLEGAFEYSDMLNDQHAFGGGPRVGLVWTPLEEWAVDLFYTDHTFISGDTHREQRAIASQRLSLTQDVTLRLDLEYTDAFQHSYWTSLLRLEKFFTP